MSAITGIEWTERTWNPVRGCSLVSEGCRSCYAMKTAHRFSGPGKPYEGLTQLGPKGPAWTGEVRTIESALLEPLSWRKPSKVFVNSMSDLFHEDVPDAFIDKVFAVMALASRHTFQILTKRPDRMLAYFSVDRYELMERVETELWDMHNVDTTNALGPWPLKNVWLGVSVENQHFADERIPLLLQTPAAVRFISAEPLLGPVDLQQATWPEMSKRTLTCDFKPHLGLDWVIVGGESGPGARPFDLAWARSIVQQCKAASVPAFVKQLGANAQDADGSMHGRYSAGGIKHDFPKLLDRKGGDPAEWPEDLRVREFPA